MIMNDNELIAWNVVDREGLVKYTCLNQNTAEYLCDWLEAIEMDHLLTYQTYWREVVGYSDSEFIDLLSRKRFFVEETEIIVG